MLQYMDHPLMLKVSVIMNSRKRKKNMATVPMIVSILKILVEKMIREQVDLHGVVLPKLLQPPLLGLASLQASATTIFWTSQMSADQHTESKITK